jgi:UDP-N-acetylglucosamine/UDP-N-acetylgalactosamine diphosphorylase
VTSKSGEKTYYDPAALHALVTRGVIVPSPEQVAIGSEVPPEAIAPGAVLHPFCRISGGATRIDAGAAIGPAGPATLHNARVGEGCVIGGLGPVTLSDTACGPGTVLGCGVAEEAVFLGKESTDTAHSTGYGFRVRKGSLYEEDASSAQHTDSKMTILFPWATLGSNSNWCDLLLAGGTGPGLGEFSEVGSGTIHFNFTPRGDKATASAFGNVVDGVFLRQPRLFLGGNGSMIGPLRAEFGAITTAGGRFSGVLHAGLNPGGTAPQGGAGFDLEVYGSIKRVYDSQIAYIGELAALNAWYGQARALAAKGDGAREALYAEGRRMVGLNIAERIAQLGRLAAAMERSAALLETRAPGDGRIAQQRALLDQWPRIEAALRDYSTHEEQLPAALGQAIAEGAANHGRVYTRIIPALPEAAVAAGRAWLAGMRDRTASAELLAAVPALPSPR